MKKILSILMLLVAIVTGAWAQTTYTYTGYNTAISNGWTHDYGDTYVGRKGSNYTPNTGGLPTGNGKIFAAFQVTSTSKIKVVFVWTKTNGDLSGKQIDLASITKETFDKLALASTGTGNDVKYSIGDFSSSQSKAVAINRSNANTEIEFEFENAVEAGYYAVYTASSINENALIKKIIVTPAGAVDPEFSLSATSIGTDETAQIKVAGKDDLDGITLSNIAYGTSGVVTVSSAGVVTPVAAGTTTITFSSAAVDGKYNAGSVTSDDPLTITVTAPVCATPVISPATFTADNQEVTITSETADATIYYTTDGATPSTNSLVYDSENKPTISSTTTFKAIAVKENYDDSAVATQKVTRTASALVGDWDFTNWSAATQAGAKGDTDAWNQYEKTGSSGMDFGENGRSNVSAISEGSTLKYSTTNIEETDGLTFKADAYGLGLIFNIGSATVSSTEYTYQGSSYLWLYNKNAVITIPSVPAGATIEIGVESHNGGSARGVTLKNGSTTLTQTQGEATSTEYQVCKWTNATAGNVTVTPSAGLHIYYIKVTGNAETVPVSTVGSNNYATYVTESNLDFSSVSDKITAYIATADNGSTITTEAVTEVPTGTALLIKTANPGSTVNVPVAASTPATLTANKLKFSNESLVITSDEATAKRYYGFFKVGEKYGFAPMKAGTLAAKKAYLDYGVGGNSLQFIALDFDDAPTAINFVEAENNANSAAPVKVIKNGKLYIGNYNVAGQLVK